MENKLNGKADSHGDDSAHLLVVQNCVTKSFKKNVVIYYLDLQIFQFKIDIVISTACTDFYVLNSLTASSRCCIPVVWQCLKNKYTIRFKYTMWFKC